LINVLKERCKYLDKLVDHQEVAHGLHNVVTSACRQQHMIDAPPVYRVDDADAKKADNVEISHHLQ
jgi:hypothetical protein